MKENLKGVYSNPFEFEGANHLSPKELLAFYIEEINYSRIVNSARNVFLIGERGSGKTMTLLYNSLEVKLQNAELKNSTVDLSKVGVYVPCNTPLFHKREFELLHDEPYKAAIIGEHYLVLTITYHLCVTLQKFPGCDIIFSQNDENLCSEFEYLIGHDIRRFGNFLTSIKNFISRQSILTQQKVNSVESDGFYAGSFTYSSLVMPFIQLIRRIPLLESTHFMIMIDDAHDLNVHQNRVLNSWIGYRDHPLFSFKVATTKVNRPELITATGGSILEGHDFVTVDMEESFQNQRSDFYGYAKRILERRLTTLGISATIEDFFPTNTNFAADLIAAEAEARRLAIKKYGDADSKAVTDYVYKYKRAIYFRSRKAKANKPPYSGFQTIVDLSTGIIRNLLDPCFYMYEKVIEHGSEVVELIPPPIQNDVILERSTIMWNRLRNGLHKEVDQCTENDSIHLFNLISNLMHLFEVRLLKHNTEPRAINFSISGTMAGDQWACVLHLINIARRCQLVYTRLGKSKGGETQETYYVLNRLLFPLHALDPHGQYARVSIPVNDLFNAAVKNRKFPFSQITHDLSSQTELFL